MSSNVPLFNQAIVQSGTASSISPENLEQKEKEYRKLLAHFGISSSDPDRLEKLRNIPSTKLSEAAKSITKGAFMPLAHPSFFPVSPDYLNQAEIVANCPWVDSVLTGDAVYEVKSVSFLWEIKQSNSRQGYLFAWSLKTMRPTDFCRHVSATLGESRASRVLGLYEISADMDPNLFWTRLCLLTGDVMFSRTSSISSSQEQRLT
jgi:carboxylesterase type B